MSLNKELLLLLGCVIFFSSCISTKRYESYVLTKYAKQDQENTKNVSLKFNYGESKLDSNVKTEKLNSVFIPALVYWKWHNTIKCSLSEKQVYTSFEHYMQRYADSLNFNEKLKGQKLILKVDSIPNKFVYTNYGNVFFFLFAYAITETEAIIPIDGDLLLSYKLVNGAEVVKSGEVKIANSSSTLNNVWKSPKKFTWYYIDQYEQNLKALSKLAIEQIEQDIL